MDSRPPAGRSSVRAFDYDVAILGGGLAGLSLAVRLVEQPRCRVLVVEPRSAYERDRTWCYWRLHGHPFEAAITRRWQSWDVLARGQNGTSRSARQTSGAVPYEMIPADRLYDLALSRIRASPNVELKLGCSALDLAEQDDGVEITTSGGLVRAGQVFDSRPPAGSGSGYAQRFLGQEVVTTKPVFDPDVVTLMDFSVPQIPGAVHFLYVLPTSRTSALVEDTWLAPADAVLPDYRRSIGDYLADRFGAARLSVEFEETGSIPMDATLAAPPTVGRIVPIGTASGAVKPSSGYAFLAIQREADRLARDLAAGAPMRARQARGAVARWMDAVFLAALRDCSKIAPDLFFGLFAGCPPAPLVRFLNDLGGPADVGRVMAAMPKAPMIAAALRTAKRGSAP